jgi:hypothetical protein
VSCEQKIARQLPDYDRGAPTPPPAQETVLVTDRSTEQVLTDRVETDAHTALTRGLAEYLLGLEAIADGGKGTRFKLVTPDYPDPEGGEDYPAAGVWSPNTGLYDASNFAPGKPFIVADQSGTLIGLSKSSELKLDLFVDVVCTDKDERTAVMAMLEQAFNPTLFMYGFRLVLPHYFGVHATYEPTGGQYQDGDASSIQNRRRARITVRANVPVISIVSGPRARVRSTVTVMESGC